jgi:hypothetical protein
MRLLGQPIAFLICAALLWLMAVTHPIVWLQAQRSAGRDGTQPHAAAQYVAMLERSGTAREMLRDEESIAYTSEAEVDTRSGGPTQARYYLTQFALAPVLVDLGSTRRQDEPEFILANFELPEQLAAYLRDRSRRAVLTFNEYVALIRARDE